RDGEDDNHKPYYKILPESNKRGNALWLKSQLHNINVRNHLDRGWIDRLLLFRNFRNQFRWQLAVHNDYKRNLRPGIGYKFILRTYIFQSREFLGELPATAFR
ncbi:31963_t:CDS:1, partial [Racocetra persica]